MFLNCLPGEVQVIVTLSLYGTSTLSGSSLITFRPSFLSSDNVTQRASANINLMVKISRM